MEKKSSLTSWHQQTGFSVAAKERAILCFRTLGQSWDVAR